MSQDETDARMAELADAPDSKSGSRKRVGVRPSLWAPIVSQPQISLRASRLGPPMQSVQP